MAGLVDLFQIAFETVNSDEPGLHKVHVLQHHPIAVSGRIKQCFFGPHFLSLAHGNIDEPSV